MSSWMAASQKPPKSSQKRGYRAPGEFPLIDQPKLTLVTLGGAFGLQNVSPFCLKAEMLMTQLGLKYDIAVQADPRKAPKGKLPYLISDGDKLPDSELFTMHIDALT